MKTLRLASVAMVLAGAVSSVGLLLRAGQHSPRLLLILFVIWVLAPFVGLLWASRVSRGWSVATRMTLYCVGIVVALASVTIYAGLVSIRPSGAGNAFPWVLVPPVSVVVVTAAIAIASYVGAGRLR